jgi:hypothetical protein
MKAAQAIAILRREAAAIDAPDPAAPKPEELEAPAT